MDLFHQTNPQARSCPDGPRSRLSPLSHLPAPGANHVWNHEYRRQQAVAPPQFLQTAHNQITSGQTATISFQKKWTFMDIFPGEPRPASFPNRKYRTLSGNIGPQTPEASDPQPLMSRRIQILVSKKWTFMDICPGEPWAGTFQNQKGRPLPCNTGRQNPNLLILNTFSSKARFSPLPFPRKFPKFIRETLSFLAMPRTPTQPAFHALPTTSVTCTINTRLSPISTGP